MIQKSSYYYIVKEDEVTVVDGNTFFGTDFDDFDDTIGSIGNFLDGYAVMTKEVYVDSYYDEEREDEYDIYDNCYYIINTECEIVTELGLGYDSVSILPGGYALVGVIDKDGNEAKGIINTNGEVVVEVGEYDSMTSFDDGEAVAKKNGCYYIINTNGDVVVEMGKYDSIGSFYDGNGSYTGVALAEKDGQVGVINRKGDMVVEFGKYDEIEGFINGGVSRVVKDDKRGVINTKGDIVVELGQYDGIYKWCCYDGFVFASKDSKKYVICTEGKVLVDFEINDVTSSVSDGYAVIWGKDGYGIITANGEVVVEFGTYDSIDGVDENGLTVVWKDGEWGVVNTKGDVIVDLGAYDSIGNFDENGLAVVAKDYEYGVINAKGEVVVELGKYDSIAGSGRYPALAMSPNAYSLGRFSNGYALAYKDGKTYIINSRGEAIYEGTE